MRIQDLRWQWKVLENKIIFYEMNREIGDLELSCIFRKHGVARLKSKRYHIHSEFMSKSRFRIFDANNERQLAVMKIKSWTSQSALEYQFQKFTLKSAFMGAFNASWHSNTDDKVISYKNQLLRGNVIEAMPDEEKYHLLLFSAICSMFIYSLLLLLMIIVVCFAIF